ncbi:MAG: signal recognition particle protein [Kiritimatiellae bacterium]|nr:signal recognition particle protein [Kiritimatiellia bacterium]
MFDKLTQALSNTFRSLRSRGHITEEDVDRAMREIRLSLLEADVNFKVARDFADRVKARCIGEKVLEGIRPADQIAKATYDELREFLGRDRHDFAVDSPPARVLLLGLHGNGKTTTAAKLARAWKAQGKNVLLAACDIRRPAAVEQLQILGREIGVDVLAPEPGEDVPALGARALAAARAGMRDIVLFDTAGRFQIDEPLVEELRQLSAAVTPQNTVLVVDAALGQEAVDVARKFHEALPLTGLVLTKLDGDARGGAALSIAHEIGCPILRVGTGEKLGDLEPFHPDRMASRILGMGDVVSLVEKVQSTMDEKTLREMGEKLAAPQGPKGLTLEDFLSQMKQVKKIGSLGKILEMLPCVPSIPQEEREKMEKEGAQKMKKSEAIIQSMTPGERRKPEILNASRRKRIARGAGVEVSDVNELVRGFRQAKQMAAMLGKRKGRMRGMFGPGR